MPTLDTLSRLKGIETETEHKDSPFSHYSFLPLDTLSRLKGIETETEGNDASSPQRFGYAFPFEGN